MAGFVDWLSKAPFVGRIVNNLCPLGVEGGGLGSALSGYGKVMYVSLVQNENDVNTPIPITTILKNIVTRPLRTSTFALSYLSILPHVVIDKYASSKDSKNASIPAMGLKAIAAIIVAPITLSFITFSSINKLIDTATKPIKDRFQLERDVKNVNDDINKLTNNALKENMRQSLQRVNSQGSLLERQQSLRDLTKQLSLHEQRDDLLTQMQKIQERIKNNEYNELSNGMREVIKKYGDVLSNIDITNNNFDNNAKILGEVHNKINEIQFHLDRLDERNQVRKELDLLEKCINELPSDSKSKMQTLLQSTKLIFDKNINKIGDTNATFYDLNVTKIARNIKEIKQNIPSDIQERYYPKSNGASPQATQVSHAQGTAPAVNQQEAANHHAVPASSANSSTARMLSMMPPSQQTLSTINPEPWEIGTSPRGNDSPRSSVSTPNNSVNAAGAKQDNLTSSANDSQHSASTKPDPKPAPTSPLTASTSTLPDDEPRSSFSPR